MKKLDADTAIDLGLPLAFQIAQLHSALNAQAKAIIAKHGNLNLAQWRILRLVAWGFADTTTAVRKAAGLDKSQFSKMLSALAAEGYVEVLPYSEDKRQHLIKMTEMGVRAHDELGPELDARQRHLLQSLDPEQRRIIQGAIKALAQAAERTDFSSSPDPNEDNQP